MWQTLLKLLISNRIILQSVIGIGFSIISWLVLSTSTQPLKFILVNSNEIDEVLQWQKFIDLDKDGKHEIVTKSKATGMANIGVINNNGFKSQANLKGDWLMSHFPFHGDYDHNGTDELYALTLKNDSILFTAYQFNHFDEPMFERFILKSKASTEDIHTNGSAIFEDFTGDGYDEVIFTINAGYSINPRAIIIYDIVKDTLWHSPLNWGMFVKIKNVSDIDKDGDLEIVINSSTPANIHNDSYIYGDSVGYMMILDQNLKIEYLPIKHFKRHAPIEIMVLDGSYYFYIRGGIFSWIKWHRNGWDTLDIISFKNEKVYFNHEWRGKQLALTYNSETHAYKSYFVNNDLSCEVTPNVLKNISQIIDVDNDGLEDIIDTDYQKNEIIIYTGEKWLKSVKKMDGNAQKITLGNNNGNLNLITKVNNEYIHFTIEKNKWYPWLIPISLFNGGLLIYIFAFILKFRRLRKESYNKRLYELQLKSIKNHVDPHFTFNILNSIRMLVIRKDTNNAEKYFDQFTLLIRHNLINADNIRSTLGDELKLADSYLSLERFRLNEKFDYTIDCSENLNFCSVPKMLIQTHLENAVKHGIFHLQNRKGLIKIVVNKNLSSLKITIIDNGIGRKKAKEIGSQNTGMGTRISQEIIYLYNKLEKASIYQRINDLPQGTQIEIEV